MPVRLPAGSVHRHKIEPPVARGRHLFALAAYLISLRAPAKLSARYQSASFAQLALAARSLGPAQRVARLDAAGHKRASEPAKLERQSFRVKSVPYLAIARLSRNLCQFLLSLGWLNKALGSRSPCAALTRL